MARLGKETAVEEKSESRPSTIWRIGGIVLLLAGLFVVYLFLGGRVTEEQIQRSERNKKSIAEFRQKRIVEQIASQRPDIKRTTANDTNTTAALDRAEMQKRCDETFESIFDTWNSTKHWGPVDQKAQDEMQKTYKALLPKMRELIALYDAGVRVSDKAKIGYCTNENAMLIGRLSYFLMENDGFKWNKKQSPDEILKYLVPAAKFERVIELPLAQGGVARCLQQLFDPDPVMLKELMLTELVNPANAYQQVIQNLDLELIAPRRAWDWRAQTPAILEYTQAWADDYAKQMSTIQGTYDYISQYNRDMSWPEKILKTAVELPFRQQNVEYHLKFVEELTAQAENVHVFQDFSKGVKDPSLAGSMVGDEIADMAEARLTCAGLHILRGEPVPTQVTPDSYFYDPYRDGRVNIEQIPMSDGNIRVKLSCRNPQTGRIPQFTFILPANHPVLKNLK